LHGGYFRKPWIIQLYLAAARAERGEEGRTGEMLGKGGVRGAGAGGAAAKRGWKQGKDTSLTYPSKHLIDIAMYVLKLRVMKMTIVRSSQVRQPRPGPGRFRDVRPFQMIRSLGGL
jgi:hypothetical protein